MTTPTDEAFATFINGLRDLLDDLVRLYPQLGRSPEVTTVPSKRVARTPVPVSPDEAESREVEAEPAMAPPTPQQGPPEWVGEAEGESLERAYQVLNGVRLSDRVDLETKWNGASLRIRPTDPISGQNWGTLDISYMKGDPMFWVTHRGGRGARTLKPKVVALLVAAGMTAGPS